MKKKKGRKKKKGDSVSGHIRKMASGKPVKVKGYKRKKRKKARGALKPFKQKYEVTFYRDTNGQLVSRRKYRKL